MAVEAFLEGRLNFLEIAAVIEAVVSKGAEGVIRGLDDVLAADAQGRQLARERIFGPRAATRTESVRGARA